MALSHSPSIITQNLVLCLDAGNPKSYPGSGTTWTDLSGNGNNGTLRNWGSPGTTIVSNVKCFYLNGSTAGTGDILIDQFYGNHVGGDNTHTFEFWAYYPGSGGFDPFNSGACGNPCIAYGESKFYFDTLGGKGVHAGVVDNEWHQYVVVQNGSNVKAYRDGFPVIPDQQSYSITTASERNDWATPTVSARSGVIGSRSWSDRQNNWYLSICKWYNKALTASEIQQNFNALRSRYSI